MSAEPVRCGTRFAMLLEPVGLYRISFRIIAGRGSPADIRGDWPTTLVAALLWYLSASWANGWAHGMWAEMMVWSAWLWHALGQRGLSLRLHKTWLATAGVATLTWCLYGVLARSPMGPMGARLCWLPLVLWGHGRVLRDAFDGCLAFGAAALVIYVAGLASLLAAIQSWQLLFSLVVGPASVFWLISTARARAGK